MTVLPFKRVLLRVLIGALSVAAAASCIALLRGDFSDTDWKVIGTSLLLSLTSALVAAGVADRPRHRLSPARTPWSCWPRSARSAA
jgi:hypothetical protein